MLLGVDLEDVGEVGGVVGADVVAGDRFGEGRVAGGDEEGRGRHTSP